MTAVVQMFLLTTLMYQGFTSENQCHSDTEIYHVSEGFLFLLRCPHANTNAEVKWSKADKGNAPLPPGVEVRDGLLWFLPVQKSHNDTYSCEIRTETGLVKMSFSLSVSTEACPEPSEVRFLSNGVSGVLPCKQEEIFGLKETKSVRWMKNCLHEQQQQEFMDKDGAMRLFATSERDAGNYTCLVDIIVDGRNYTAARSLQLAVDNGTVYMEPQVVMPNEDVFIVEVGMKAEVKCLAYVGVTEDSEMIIFWTVDGSYSENYEEMNVSSEYFYDGGKVYYMSILSISKVLHRFLDVPIKCHIQSPLDNDEGTAWLREDHSVFQLSTTLCLIAVLISLALAFLFFFRVDLILAYRKLLKLFSKRVTGGKQYDAYVSFLHPESMNSYETARFALQILPAELEGKHGYTLYIRGRDDSPGEALHDVVSAAVRQSRRLIIIVSSLTETKETVPLHETEIQLCYEHKIGIFDALTQNNLRVILLEVGDTVNYSRLPESLRYIKRKHGALKWNSVYLKSCKLSKKHSERNFWKNLRYHMPSVPVRNLLSGTSDSV
ncbi:interleukin-1 receptor type 1-like [Gouania willdenowi]|uniref:Interleukin-1 receptor type 1-like n=1 Tax=Gouania willdenowi TaxID=441366 RepID=A0A8C5E1P4_GOUWI|nr:interleukin-1 receptor type 1-like [Gouania willdenowi]